MTFQPVTKSPLAESRAPFELKGGLFTVTVMYLHQAELENIEQHLIDKIQKAPDFFKNAPVVIDLGKITQADNFIDFSGLCELLRNRGMIPVGVRGGSSQLQAAAVTAGLPLFPEARTPAALKKPEKSDSSPVQRTKVITQPVRSGQQIYAPDSDLVVLGPISPGAEVLADGNIHIYSTLRGRSLAGVKGDTGTWIFCQQLEGELVAIAGHYRVIEQLDAGIREKPVKIHLAEERLIIEPLSRQ